MSQHFKLHFAYGQIMIYDASVTERACRWTDNHVAQGFIRLNGLICFGTLLQEGIAEVEVVRGSYVASDFERVIRCPLKATSGTVWVVGPEEWPEPDDHLIDLSAGSWSVACGQSVSGERRLRVMLWFTPGASAESQILRVDRELHPPSPLIETGEVFEQNA